MKVHLIPILRDNYVFCFKGEGGVTVVDPGEAAPVLAFLQARDWRLERIFITHHHGDHVDGVPTLLKAFPQAQVVFPLVDQGRFSFPGQGLSEGDEIEGFQVLSLPGHTLDHVAYFHPQHLVLFCGDVLFGFGCGRVMEGTFAQAFESLMKIRRLPDQTAVFCTHEYTQTNLRFLESIGESPPLEIRKAFSKTTPTIPLELGVQKAHNPFLGTQFQEFIRLRELRNQF